MLLDHARIAGDHNGVAKALKVVAELSISASVVSGQENDKKSVQ
jgi:hypothetical protein